MHRFVYVAPRQPRWLALINIFKPMTWLVFFSVLLISGFTWFILGKILPEQPPHKNLILCLLNNLSVFLGISANNRPERTPLRVFFIILALYGLNITTIYTSKLIYIFAHPPYEEQIDTIEEIIESRLPFGGREEYHDWFENEFAEDQIFLQLYNYSDRFLPTMENLQRVRDGKQVMLLNRIFVLSKTMTDIFALPKNVISSPLEMIAERGLMSMFLLVILKFEILFLLYSFQGFPLLRRFSNIIMYLKDSGIMMKLYNNFLFNVTVLEYIRDRNKIQTQDLIVLTTQHLDGAFGVLFLGLTISALVFLLEIMSKTKFIEKLFGKLSKKQKLKKQRSKLPSNKIKKASGN